jgi:TetR/AcrR family transcriptional repressor of multidrug resistance operon
MNVQSTMNANTREMISDKKRAIFESTLELIKDHGFHGAPMSLVAKNAGVAAGTIYHYFESKEKLICELYTYNRNRVVELVNEVIGLDISYKEKFFKIWTMLYDFYIHQPNVLIFFEQFLNSPYNADKFPNHFEGVLFNFFAEGIKSRRIKSVKPEIALVLILGSINSTAKLSLFGKIPLKQTDLKHIVQILWDGISVPEPANGSDK